MVGLIMKLLLTLLAAVTIQAQAETVITQHGNYVVSTAGSTTYVTGPSKGSNAVAIATPVNVNPVTGIGQVITPQGSYLVQRSGSTTTVIQTSKGK
jgi:hypothetical protein